MLERRTKYLQCDIGGEFKAFEHYLKQERIRIRYSCPYIHRQNRKAKRKPDLSMFRVFGCECYPLLRPYNSYKFDFLCL